MVAKTKVVAIKRLTHLKAALTLRGAFYKKGVCLTPDDLSVIPEATLVYDDQRILWVGPEAELPESYDSVPVFSGQGGIVTPELVDCHTHLVFGGNRAGEYSLRLAGADYQEIARAGGGILSTVRMTRELPLAELFTLAKSRCERLHSYGVGTIEIKSGYGLDFISEYELSHLIHELQQELAPRVQVRNTFMAAHAVPAEYPQSSVYLQDVVLPLLEVLWSEGVIDAVDIFHEQGYFGDEDVRELFTLARELGVPRRSHADEFADNKGALLACEYGALSTDHLLCTGDDGIAALAQSETVATLLPGTGFFLGRDQARARAFLDGGCRVAIGSDYNPGSCHFDNVWQIAAMAAPRYQMNLAELWAAVTLNSAQALGLNDQGALVEGLAPRFSFFRASSVDEVSYFWGRNLAYWPQSLAASS